MGSQYDFVELVYEYPIGLPPPSGEDYFFLPVSVAREMGMKPAIFASVTATHAMRRETIKGIDVVRTPNPILTLANLSRSKPLLVHGHSFGFIPASLGPLFSRRYALTPHIYKLAIYSKWKAMLVLKLAKRSDAIVALTKFEAFQFSQVVPGHKIHIIPHPVDYTYFSGKPASSSDEFLRKYGLTRENEIILSAANLQPRKNLETLIKAFGLVKARFPSSRLVIAGGQPTSVLGLFGSAKPKWNYLTVLAKSAAAIGARDSVMFVGYQSAENLRSFYNAAKVFCLPSRMEGQLLAAGEAASSGLPLVLSNLEPLVEIYNECALFHAPMDHRELAHQIIRLLTDTELASSLGKAGRRKMRSYSPAEIRPKLRALYEELVPD